MYSTPHNKRDWMNNVELIINELDRTETDIYGGSLMNAWSLSSWMLDKLNRNEARTYLGLGEYYMSLGSLSCGWMSLGLGFWHGKVLKRLDSWSSWCAAGKYYSCNICKREVMQRQVATITSAQEMFTLMVEAPAITPTMGLEAARFVIGGSIGRNELQNLPIKLSNFAIGEIQTHYGLRVYSDKEF